MYVADRRDGLVSVDREKETALPRAWNKVGLCGKVLSPRGTFMPFILKNLTFGRIQVDGNCQTSQV